MSDSDILGSSGELSHLSDDAMVVTPLCPICTRNYTKHTKPMSLQPCGHGICKSCLDELKQHSHYEAICPICRGTIISEAPNYDLREITENVNNKEINGHWERHVSEIATLRGHNIKFSREMRPYAKVLCVRIAYDTVLVNIQDRESWTEDEAMAIANLTNAMVKSIRRAKCTLDDAFRWISVLSVSKSVETHLCKFVIDYFDDKAFLDGIDGGWFFDVITFPI